MKISWQWWKLAQNCVFCRFWYLPSNGAIANVVLHHLDLHCQGQHFLVIHLQKSARTVDVPDRFCFEIARPSHGVALVDFDVKVFAVVYSDVHLYTTARRHEHVPELTEANPHTQTHIQTHKLTHSHTHTQSHTHTNTHTHTHTHTTNTHTHTHTHTVTHT